MAHHRLVIVRQNEAARALVVKQSTESEGCHDSAAIIDIIPRLEKVPRSSER